MCRPPARKEQPLELEENFAAYSIIISRLAIKMAVGPAVTTRFIAAARANTVQWIITIALRKVLAGWG